MKKKVLAILIGFTVIFLIGCNKDEPVSDFIPTQAPSQNNDIDDISDGNISGEDDQVGNGDSDQDDIDDNPDDIIDDEEDDIPTYVGDTKTMYVKLNQYDSTLYVREKPTTESERVGFLVHTEKVEVINIEEGWASLVFTDGKVRYVSSSFLVENKPAILLPPTPTPTPEPTPSPTPAITSE